MSTPPKILSGRTVTGPVSARMTVDGRPYINFFGAGYLALSNVPEIRSVVRRLLDEGAPLAQHLPAAHGATDSVFDAVERAAAAACGSESAIYFASGYLIGAAGLASLHDTFDVIAIDASAHFNLKDGAKLSGKPTFEFAHCDSNALEALLRRELGPKQRPLVVTDGAFATSGRIPPLEEYARIIVPYDGRLFIDEAHSFGIVGENGRGAAEYCGVQSVATIGATCSKAYCAFGAFIACSRDTALRLRTTPPTNAANAGSPLLAAAAAASLDYVAIRPQLRDNVRAMTKYLRSRLRQIGIDVPESPAPIVSFQLGRRADMQALQRRAFECGIYIHHSNYIGAGPDGVIRCAVFRDHTRDDIDALISVLL